MAAPYLLIGIDEDAEEITLGHLVERIQNAMVNGKIPADTVIKSGYNPNFLRSCLYVQTPEDLTTLSFEDLRRRAIKNNAETSVPAWAEIERRVEALAAYEA